MMKLPRRLWEGWRETTGYIGDFQARLLLTVFYFSVAVPFGLLARLTGDPLNMRYLPANSGWVKRRTRDTDLQASERQY